MGSFDHLLDCTGMRPLDDEDRQDEEKAYEFLGGLAFHAYNVNPDFPAHMRPSDNGEIELFGGDFPGRRRSVTSEGPRGFEIDNGRD